MISMITDMRQKPINSFCCTTTNFANLGFFAKISVLLQFIISRCCLFYCWSCPTTSGARVLYVTVGVGATCLSLQLLLVWLSPRFSLNCEPVSGQLQMQANNNAMAVQVSLDITSNLSTAMFRVI